MKTLGNVRKVKNSYIEAKELAISMGLEFQEHLTNYTSKLVTGVPTLDVHILNKGQNVKIFATYAKIKNEVKNIPKELIPNLRPEDCQFFGTSSKIKVGHEGTVFNIDIKSAYLTALFNLGYIGKELFEEISTKCTKEERLVSIGMLGSETFIFRYFGELLEDVEIKQNEYRGIFFDCVKYTDQIMGDLIKIIGDSYLFFWVDGIYFKDESKIPEIKKYLENQKMCFSMDVLNNFSVGLNKKGKYTVNFEKDGEKKVFLLPPFASTISRDLLRELKKEFQLK
jgi:hypothetical protein